jgi:putative cell wall-binding protein
VVKAELQRLGPDRVFILGGTGVVSGSVVNAIDAALP